MIPHRIYVNNPCDFHAFNCYIAYYTNVIQEYAINNRMTNIKILLIISIILYTGYVSY